MTQRNPLNERYTNDEKTAGKTRKSAASAKPASKAASSVREPGEKSKKQKKKEHEERVAKSREKRGLNKADTGYVYELKTDEYKRLRRYYWISLVLGLLCTALAFIFNTIPSLVSYMLVPLIFAYVFIIAAFYIDFAKLRKLRKEYNSPQAGKTKSARAEQKKLHADAIEQRREAAAAAAAGIVPEEEEKGFGPLKWFRNSSKKATKAKADLQEKADAVKASDSE